MLLRINCKLMSSSFCSTGGDLTWNVPGGLRSAEGSTRARKEATAQSAACFVVAKYVCLFLLCYCYCVIVIIDYSYCVIVNLIVIIGYWLVFEK